MQNKLKIRFYYANILICCPSHTEMVKQSKYKHYHIIVDLNLSYFGSESVLQSILSNEI